MARRQGALGRVVPRSSLLLTAWTAVNAECPNACSAHGKCGAYDMCTCYRNWMSNDCSERVCQFGLAHVDTPKGDLDASSGQLTGPATTVVVNSPMYPSGTSEQFPNMLDSDQRLIDNSAHYYMECSNKGICDRQSGTCNCFEGYGGSACQRAQCPDTGSGVCSGHGTCENIKTISAWDYNNVYKLWDEQATMGCVCDGGYQGANCEEKICKFGADPLYQDSFQTVRYSNWTYSIYTKSASAVVKGNYSLVFTDATGEDWATIPIDIGANCQTVSKALEGLPNNAIKANSVLCHQWPADTVWKSNPASYEPVDTSFTKMHTKFSVAFPSNPGVLKDLSINTHLDGTRTTLFTDEATSTLGWYIFSNGFYGENDDFVPDLCAGVLVTVAHGGAAADTYDRLDSLTAAELILLKKCLGDANGDETDNLATDVHNWDYGTDVNPHLIKLVDATQEDLDYADADPTHYTPNRMPKGYMCNQSATGAKDADGFCDRPDPPGFYAAIYWDNTNSMFRVFGRPATDYSTSTNFHVYTTKGTLQRVSSTTLAFNTWNIPNWQNVQYGNLLTNKIYTHAKTEGGRHGLDCDTKPSASSICLKKGDYMMVLNTGLSYAGVAAGVTTDFQAASNAIYPQIYQVKKISREPIPVAEWATAEPGAFDFSTQAKNPTFVRDQIVTDKAFNVHFHLDTVSAISDTSAAVFKFTPPANKYTYAGPCSNRGICDHGSGLCNCFAGFTNDNCDTIDALAA